MGSSIWWGQHRWLVVRGGKNPAYQPSGADGGCLRYEDPFEREAQHPCPSEDGQYSSYLVPQPYGRDEIVELVTQGVRTVAVVPSTRDHPVGRASAGSTEHGSGHRISHSEVIGRMEAGLRSINQSHAGSRNLLDRPVRIQAEQSATQIYELETRPIFSEHKRIADALAEREKLCLPPPLP